MNTIYLDHNSTTPQLPEVTRAMLEIDQQYFGNPSSSHQLGRAARRYLEEAREGLAALLKATPGEVIFTSGATEANNLAIFGLLQQPGLILASKIEHPCVTEPIQQLVQQGHRVDWLPVDTRGKIDVSQAMPMVNGEAALLCVMLANHETGTIQPVRHLSKIRRKSMYMHCDAAQAAGKLPIDFQDLGVTTLTLSGHKFGGPRGIGLLLLKSGTRLKSQLFGGHQQRGFRPGTEPVSLAYGLYIALKHRLADLPTQHKKLLRLQELLRTRLMASVPPVVFNSPSLTDNDLLPTTLNVSFPGCRADLLLVSLDLNGVACSTGSACSSGSLLPSPVLQEMRIPDEILRSAIRLSISPDCEESLILEAANRIIRAVQNARQARQ